MTVRHWPVGGALIDVKDRNIRFITIFFSDRGDPDGLMLPPQTLQALLASPLLKQFLRFASVGFVATAAHYAVLVAMVEGPGWPIPATVAGLTRPGLHHLLAQGDRDGLVLFWNVFASRTFTIR